MVRGPEFGTFAFLLGICINSIPCCATAHSPTDPGDIQCPSLSKFFFSMLIIFPSLSSPCFHLFSLKVGRRNGRVCVWAGGVGWCGEGGGKTQSSSRSSVAFDSSGCIWLCPDKTWAHTESDSVELFARTHWLLWAQVCLDGPEQAWWRIPSQPHQHPRRRPPHPTSVRLKIPQCSCQGGVKGAKDLGLQMFQQVKDKRWEEGHRRSGADESKLVHESKFRHKVQTQCNQLWFIPSVLFVCLFTLVLGRCPKFNVLKSLLKYSSCHHLSFLPLCVFVGNAFNYIINLKGVSEQRPTQKKNPVTFPNSVWGNCLMFGI